MPLDGSCPFSSWLTVYNNICYISYTYAWPQGMLFVCVLSTGLVPLQDGCKQKRFHDVAFSWRVFVRNNEKEGDLRNDTMLDWLLLRGSNFLQFLSICTVTYCRFRSNAYSHDAYLLDVYFHMIKRRFILNVSEAVDLGFPGDIGPYTDFWQNGVLRSNASRIERF